MRQKKPIVNGPISLKKLAEHLGLNAATISVVLNGVPGRSIPQATRDRIKAAAKEFNYQPSFLARSLRNRRTRQWLSHASDEWHWRSIDGGGILLLHCASQASQGSS